MRNLLEFVGFAGSFVRKDAPRLATLELTRFCNRRCSYCQVPTLYNPETELTVDESKQVIGQVGKWGFRILSIIGGEPLADAMNKEGVSHREHTLHAARHAAVKGMFVSITSNGDYLDEALLKRMSEAGVRSLILSLHTYRKAALDSLIKKAITAREKGIIPCIFCIFTESNTEYLLGISSYVISKGLLFGVGIYQDYATGLRTKRTNAIPSPEQQRFVFDAAMELKPCGLIRTNRNYLRQAPELYPNNWKCNPDRNVYLHVGPEGTLNVCGNVRTDIKVLEIDSLQELKWRETKRELIKHCGNCLHQCLFEVENPDPIGDIPTFLIGSMMALGQHKLVERWGAWWASLIAARDSKVDWSLKLK